jgi:hypothetical protein
MVRAIKGAVAEAVWSCGLAGEEAVEVLCEWGRACIHEVGDNRK